MSIEEQARLAREQNMSYGQMQALKYLNASACSKRLCGNCKSRKWDKQRYICNDSRSHQYGKPVRRDRKGCGVYDGHE